MPEQAFSFLRINERPPKPRAVGLTEIRGPYYTPLGKRHLEDILETIGEYVDSPKFAGGSFSLMPRGALIDLLKLCHDHNVLVSTGGFLEYVLTQGPDAVAKYIEECKRVGFDIIEISCGFIPIPAEDWLRLVERVQKSIQSDDQCHWLKCAITMSVLMRRSFPANTRDAIRPARLCDALDGLAEAGIDARFGAARDKLVPGYPVPGSTIVLSSVHERQAGQPFPRRRR